MLDTVKIVLVFKIIKISKMFTFKYRKYSLKYNPVLKKKPILFKILKNKMKTVLKKITIFFRNSKNIFLLFLIF